MLTEKRKTGNVGEDIACRFLQEKGYKIIERNYLTRVGEIDIVADLDGQLIFIEVKARASNFFGYPEEFVNKKKIEKMQRAINSYLQGRDPYQNKEYQIDIIAVELNAQTHKAKISHFKNVLY